MEVLGVTDQKSRDCCHKDCAAGCVGPYSTDCHACKFYENEGKCVETCPPLTMYNPETLQHRPNPDAKWVWSTLCVKECPHPFLKEHGYCVSACRNGSVERNGECVPCDGPCAKSEFRDLIK